MMNESSRDTGKRSPAEVYEEFFLPALFEDWARRVADMARIEPGQRVLDVACGTGVLARVIAPRIGSGGSVEGLDRNDGMLAVARRKAPRIVWHQGRAEALPFESGSFDRVVSQFGLMFFEDRSAAIDEMVRVLRPGGRLAVAVWAALERSPGYAALTDLIQRLFGDEAAAAMLDPYALGDQARLRSLFTNADIPDVTITTYDGTARFPSVEALVYTEVKGWTLANVLDDAQFELLLEQSEQALRPFVAVDGRVAFPVGAHIVTATKAG